LWYEGDKIRAPIFVSLSQILKMAFEQFSPMLRVFKDPALQQQMEEMGYVVVPFYTGEEMDELLQVFQSQHASNRVSGFFSSTFSMDTDYRKRANDAIVRICKRRMDELLIDYKVWCGSFLVKASDEQSHLSVHQDMTLVDESKFSGFNIWCPLIDLTKENGPLMVLPGSHRLVPTLRGSTIPGIYEDTHELIYELMDTLILHAGTAVIFDQSIIHASPPNRSGLLRPVTNTFFTHQDAKIITCFNDKEKSQVELFEQEDDFMTEYINFGFDIHARPSIGRSLGLIPYAYPRLTKEMLLDRYPRKKARGSNWLSAIKALFNA
jgi:ectoine hydroxylase-related dioxygenase (phytanoyl-CoA dioxygenase family)